MTASRGFPTDDWMREQQLRAEMEAEAWRRLRADMAVPEPVPTAPDAEKPRELDPHGSGSTILKALVRFGLAAFVSYLAYLAAADSQLGEFEIWLAIGSTFLVTLALSMFGPARRFVHVLAETARWVIISGLVLGILWFATHMQA
jgi:hypothetical protein